MTPSTQDARATGLVEDMPAGMTEWGPDSAGYPKEPEDWDGDAVMFRSGLSCRFPGPGMCWEHGLRHARAVEIIGYTPRALAASTKDQNDDG